MVQWFHLFSILCLKYLNCYLNCNYGSVLDVSNVIHRFDQSSWWDSAFSFRALYNCLCGLDYIYSWESVLFPCVLCRILVFLVFNFWNDSGYLGRQFWLWVGTLIGEGNGTPLQYSCLDNPMDGGAWKAAVHGVAEGRAQLSDFTFLHWRRKWQPTPVFLPGEFQGRGSLVGCPLWGCTELDMTEVT